MYCNVSSSVQYQPPSSTCTRGSVAYMLPLITAYNMYPVHASLVGLGQTYYSMSWSEKSDTCMTYCTNRTCMTNKFHTVLYLLLVLVCIAASIVYLFFLNNVFFSTAPNKSFLALLVRDVCASARVWRVQPTNKNKCTCMAYEY